MTGTADERAFKSGVSLSTNFSDCRLSSSCDACNQIVLSDHLLTQSPAVARRVSMRSAVIQQDSPLWRP